MRPTDICHPNELRAPAPRAFPARSRSFRCVDTPRSLRLRAVGPGDRTFHDVRDRFGGSSSNTALELCASRPQDTSVGVFFPRCGCDRASDTPVAVFGSPSRLTRLRVCCKLAARPSFERFRTGRRVPRSSRPPVTPSRESRRLVMIRDAFHRQGPFVGSGGPYSPGPATSAPLVAM